MRPELYRVFAILTVWIVFAILAAIVILSAGANFILLGILGFITWLVTDSLSSAFDIKEVDIEELEKQKRHITTTTETDLIYDLLDESDLADLREQLKQRLAEKITRADDGELTTLDALLAEQYESSQQRHHHDD
jgi:hypothetical protein